MAYHHWAAHAFIQSYIDSYTTLYGCQAYSSGNLNFLHYSANIPAKMENAEVFSLDSNPDVVLQTTAHLPIPTAERFVLNVFHPEQETQDIEKRFEAAGFRYAFTNVVRGLPLPAPLPDRGIPVSIIQEPGQVDFVNFSHQYFQPIPDTVLANPQVRAFYASLDGQAAGWGLLVTSSPEAAYISDMFTLPSFRGRGVAEALLRAMHETAAGEGKKYCLLVPSVMAWNYYQRFGYETLVCFSIFHQVNH